MVVDIFKINDDDETFCGLGRQNKATMDFPACMPTKRSQDKVLLQHTYECRLRMGLMRPMADLDLSNRQTC